MHLVGNNSSMQPPHYGLWVNLHFFTMWIYKHCFLPMLLVFAIKCWTKMPCPLPHSHYCCSLPSPVRLPHLLICTCLISSPIAVFFLLYVTFLCDFILACLCTYFLFRFYCYVYLTGKYVAYKNYKLRLSFSKGWLYKTLGRMLKILTKRM